MPPSPSAQLDLNRRYARELRRLQTEARSAFQRSETAFSRAARDLRNGVIPGGPEQSPQAENDEIAPGVGHA